MGLFGDDTSFSSAKDRGYQTVGGYVPSGFTQYSGPEYTDKYGTALLQGQTTNGLGGTKTEAVKQSTVEGLLGNGYDSSGKRIDWQQPGTYSNANLDLILGNRSTLQQGELLPFQQAQFQRAFLNNPQTVQSDPTAYLYNGDPNWAANQNAALQAQAAGAMGRSGPVIDQTGLAPWQQGQAGAAMLAAGAGNNAADLSGRASALANGQAVQGQFNAGNQQLGAGGAQMGIGGQLQSLAGMPAGPSVAEQAMRMQAGQNERQQAALAAGARGGNSALALQGAAGNAAAIGGQLDQQLGIQRAQEDMANRQFSAQTLGSAANVFGGAGNTFGGAGNTFGNAGGTQLNAYGTGLQGQGTAISGYNAAGGIAGQGAGLQGQIATQNAGNALNQTQLNQTYGLGSQQLGYDVMGRQLQGTSAYDQNRTGNAANILTNQYANRDRSGEGTITGSAGGDKVLGGVLSGAATVGAAAASDVRAKTKIAPAGDDIADAFRPLSASSYFYKNPEAVGARGGRQFGPMAQELERTPAGATAVTELPDGKKGIDTGRLALLNASATANLQREIDALKGQAGQIQGTTVQYPQSVAAFPDVAPRQVPDLGDAMAQAQRIRATQVAYPQPRPYALGGV